MQSRVQWMSFCVCLLLITGCGGSDRGAASAEKVSSFKILGGNSVANTVEEDELVLPNDRTQYQITSTAAGYTITSIADDGKSQTLPILRRIQFADVSLALDIEHSSKIYRLYQAAFDRKPDLAGLGFWLEVLDKDVAIETIAENFIASAEFQQLYGVNPDNTQFLTKLYNNVLHRSPDASGLAYWLNLMQQGLSKARALIEFSESAENKSAIAASIENGIAYAQPGVSYRPVSNAGKSIQTTTKSTVALDGAASTDVNGEQLSFNWSLTSKPATSTAYISLPSTRTPTFIPDVDGVYTLSLVVNNRTRSSRPSTLTVTASAAPVAPITDTGIYKCSLLSRAQAEILYLAGHTYLDRDHDGKPCEANDIVIENPVVTTPITGKLCWVNGYTKKNGTDVHGYWRRC